MSMEAKPIDIIMEFKRWAAQIRQNGRQVYRWYQKLVHATMIVEICLWREMPKEMRLGWKEHKAELKELGFGIAKLDEEDFILFCNAENARKWLEDDKILAN